MILVCKYKTDPEYTSNTLNIKLFLGGHAPRPPLAGELHVQVHLTSPPHCLSYSYNPALYTWLNDHCRSLELTKNANTFMVIGTLYNGTSQ